MVSHARSALPARVADKTGLTRALSSRLADINRGGPATTSGTSSGTWRCDRIASHPGALDRLRAAHAVARLRAWKLTGTPARVDIDVDATLLTAIPTRRVLLATSRAALAFTAGWPTAITPVRPWRRAAPRQRRQIQSDALRALASATPARSSRTRSRTSAKAAPASRICTSAYAPSCSPRRATSASPTSRIPALPR